MANYQMLQNNIGCFLVNGLFAYPTRKIVARLLVLRTQVFA